MITVKAHKRKGRIVKAHVRKIKPATAKYLRTVANGNDEVRAAEAHKKLAADENQHQESLKKRRLKAKGGKRKKVTSAQFRAARGYRVGLGPR